MGKGEERPSPDLCNKAHRANKYRLYPKEEQAAQLNQSFASVHWVYNAAL